MCVEFTDSLNKRYMAVIPDQGNTADGTFVFRMITENRITGVLGGTPLCIDGIFMFCFDITGMMSLEKILSDRPADEKLIAALCGSLAETALSLNRYLIGSSHIMVKPERIFFDKESRTFSFGAAPAEEARQKKDLQELADFVLSKLDAGSSTAAQMGYRFYRSCISGMISVEEMRAIEGLYSKSPDAPRDNDRSNKAVIQGRKDVPGHEMDRQEADGFEMGRQDPDRSDTSLQSLYGLERDIVPLLEEPENTGFHSIPEEKEKKRGKGRAGGILRPIKRPKEKRRENPKKPSKQEEISGSKHETKRGLKSRLSGDRKREKKGLPFRKKREKKQDLQERTKAEESRTFFASALDRARPNGSTAWQEEGLFSEQEDYYFDSEEEPEDPGTLLLNDPRFRQGGTQGVNQGTCFLVAADIFSTESHPVTGNICRIGRAESKCDIVVDNAAVSRNHARLLRNRDTYDIVDEGSRNGTTVNGQTLIGNVPYTLSDGDEISFAGSSYYFRINK